MTIKSALACVAFGAILAIGGGGDALARSHGRYEYCYYHNCSGRWHDPNWRRHREEWHRHHNHRHNQL